MQTFPETWSLGAVGEALEPLAIEEFLSATSAADRAVRAWFRLVYHLSRQPNHEESKFELCPEHDLCFNMLRDWWVASYQDSAFTLAALRHFFGYEISDTGFHISMIKCWGKYPTLFQTLRTQLTLERQPSESFDITRLAAEEGDFMTTPVQSYNSRLMFLFKDEFLDKRSLDPATEPVYCVDLRREQRGSAAAAAYCQQFAWCIYVSYKAGITNDPQLGLRPRPPEYITEGRLALSGPVVNPCAWLETSVDEFRNLPYYLWDVKTRCTVETRHLPINVQYIAISHTWGRWGKPEPPIHVQGVPWRVPQNTRFEVTELPEIVQKLVLQIPGGIQYVWLDLITIPQDRSAIGIAEIARQAKIFRGAKRAVAWLNDVDSFAGLGSILEFVCLHLLKFNCEDDQAHLIVFILHATTNIIGKGCGIIDETNYAENPWFSSLWCLQEMCLRPDMWFAARDGKLLFRSDLVPVPLSGLVSLLQALLSHGSPIPEGEEKTYLGMTMLMHWHIASGLDALLQLDVSSILTLGETRVCTARRGEAIMSALGVTDWFTSTIKEDPDAYSSLEKDLVLGKYPLAFVNELAKKRPREFFGTAQRLHLDEKYADPSNADPFKADPFEKGSLLPFGEKRDSDLNTNVILRIFGGRMNSCCVHSSVQKWHVDNSGSVHMPTVGILSSKTRPTEDVLPVMMIEQYAISVAAPLSAIAKEYLSIPEHREKQWVNLHRWVAQQPRETHAVILDYYSLPGKLGKDDVSLHGRGVIVERLDTSQFAMVCHFVFHDMFHTVVDVEKAQEVIWLVL